MAAPGPKEFNRAMQRAGKASFNDWNDEVCRQTTRLATRQALRIVGGTPKEMRFFMRARDDIAKATNRSVPPDKIAIAAVMRRIPKDLSQLRLDAFNLAYRYAKSRILRQIKKQIWEPEKFRDLIGLPPDSEIHSIFLDSVKGNPGYVERVLRKHVIELAAKHALRAVDGNPAKLGGFADTFDNIADTKNARNAFDDVAVQTVGKEKAALFAQTYFKNIGHI